MTILYISVAVLIILLILNNIKPQKNISFPYESKKYLMTKSEMHFYKTLLEAASTKKLIVMSKVRLWDLIYVSKGVENQKSFENKISSKHIDFVLCNPETSQPVLAVELDDSSHQRKDRQLSDDFKNNALASAKLPLLRVPVQKDYDFTLILKQIEQITK